MIVAEDVQRAVHDEANELRLQAVAGVFARPPATDRESFRVRPTTRDEGPGSCWADVDIAENRAVGLRQSEGDDVGQAATSGRSAIQASHGRWCEQGQLDARPAGPFPSQHARRHPRQRVKQRAARAAKSS